MGNTLLTPKVIAKAALAALQNNMVFAGLVHRDYSSEFVKKGDTITVRKPATFTAKLHNGSTIEVQEATETGVDVKMDKLVDVSFEITSKELTLSLKDFTEQFIEPAMRAHAQYLDSLLAGLYIDIPYNKAVSGTAVIGDIANVGAVLNDNKAPMSNRHMVLEPTTHAKYIVLDAVLHAEKSGSTDALRKASMGNILGFDSYMDQNIQSHTKGDLAAAATGTVDVSVDPTLVTVASGGNVKTVKKGDIVSFAGVTGKSYIVLADKATDSTGAGTFNVYPALEADISAATITVTASHKANLAFHKNAFALVTRPLETPLGAAKCEVVNWNGMSLRIVYGYDMQKKADIVSIDMLCGVKTLTPELACRFLG
jgi:hypothetical protein